MPRASAFRASGSLLDNITLLSLTPPTGGQFSLLSAEIAFQFTAATPTDDGGLIDIVMATSAGTTVTSVTPKPFDPDAGTPQVAVKANYSSEPSKATPMLKIACPSRLTQYLFWEEGEFVVSGSLPLLFVHHTGASMPLNSTYKLTVEWSE